MGTKHVITESKGSANMPMRMAPSLSFMENELPEMKDWNIGKTYRVEIEMEMTGINKSEWEKGKPIRGSFTVKSVKDLTDKNPLDMSKSEFGKKYVQARSGNA